MKKETIYHMLWIGCFLGFAKGVIFSAIHNEPFWTSAAVIVCGLLMGLGLALAVILLALPVAWLQSQARARLR